METTLLYRLPSASSSESSTSVGWTSDGDTCAELICWEEEPRIRSRALPGQSLHEHILLDRMT